MSILVIRLSSIGDVVLTIPVFKTLEKAFPDQHFYLLTQKKLAPLFEDFKQVDVIGIDTKNEYTGVTGLIQLGKYLLNYSFDTVVDLHDVLRSKILRKWLQANGKKIYVFEKGRSDKKDAIKKKKALSTLPHTTERYLATFHFLGKKLQLEKTKNYFSDEVSENDAISKYFPSLDTNKPIIGFSPFSKHDSKEWDEEKWLQLIQKLEPNNNLFVFAFGEREREIVSEWKRKHPTLQDINEKIALSDQLQIIQQFKTMISVDSANMHLAALSGIPVVSIWMATHPSIGFSPLNNQNGIIQPSQGKAPWRPFSIYGKIKTKHQPLIQKTRDLISVDEVLDRLKEL